MRPPITLSEAVRATAGDAIGMLFSPFTLKLILLGAAPFALMALAMGLLP